MNKNLSAYSSYFIYPEDANVNGILTPLLAQNLSCGHQSNFKKAIYDIIQKQPKIIFIALDHPQCRWSQFQQSLEECYSCVVVPFISRSTVATVTQLKMTFCEYKVLPPNTPENFLKIIKKIMLSQQVNHKQTRYEKKNGNTPPNLTSLTLTELESSLQVIDVNIFENQYGVWPHAKSPFSSQVQHSTQRGEPLNEEAFYKKLSSYLNQSGSQFFENQPLQKQDYKALNEVKKAQCISIESDVFTGHLLTATVDEKQIPEDFLDRLHEKILNFIKVDSQKFFADEKLKLDIRSVHFKDWAKEDANFTRQTIHQNMEVAIGFFPADKVKLDILETENPEMSKIDIRDIEALSIIGASLYLHLPNNRKYIHYVPEGTFLHDELKDRLLTKGITHLHFYTRDKEKLKKSLTESKINKKIESYHRKQTPATLAV